MAKDHLLPRYLLRAAVCVCVLLGGGVLAGYLPFAVRDLPSADRHLPFAVRHLPETDNQGADGRQHIVGASVRLYANERHQRKANSKMRNAQSKQLTETYQSEIGIKEATGNNDGSRVGAYLRYCGLDEGYAWCAAFVSWCYGQAGFAEPRNAWSPALFPASRTIWHAGKQEPLSGGQPIPRAGDVFGIYYTNLKRIAHVGFVDGWDGKYGITVEGNTGPEGAIAGIGNPANPIRAGPSPQGVYRKRRPIRTIKAVARWTE